MYSSNGWRDVHTELCGKTYSKIVTSKYENIKKKWNKTAIEGTGLISFKPSNG